MGHIPTTDPGALASVHGGHGHRRVHPDGREHPADRGRAARCSRAALTPDAALPPLIAIDQEGGDVSADCRGTPSPPRSRSRTSRRTRRADAFAGRGALVLRAGIGVNFGIVADVTADPSSFIYRRALGTTPDAGAARVGAAVAGEQDAAFVDAQALPGSRRRTGGLALRHPVDRDVEGGLERGRRAAVPRRDRRRRADR